MIVTSALKLRILDAAAAERDKAMALTGLDRLEAMSHAAGLLDAIKVIEREEVADLLANAKPDPEVPGIGPAERMAIADYARQKGER